MLPLYKLAKSLYLQAVDTLTKEPNAGPIIKKR